MQLQELNSYFSKAAGELLLCVACLNPCNSFSSFDKKLIRLVEFYPMNSLRWSLYYFLISLTCIFLTCNELVEVTLQLGFQLPLDVIRRFNDLLREYEFLTFWYINEVPLLLDLLLIFLLGY
ncbi:hypothetical protein RHMOL_Rhmol01G0156700 [Rhododendron molle]|uniref:Uncharacterized protein n=1 Tax=Rhododendron molle TaxID=49168 RepID=A0ACC0Q3B3_RHOML|nr:hypothetical protein RHMOL_Rhmol01G0156700 [Rhododendron molle]